jgi:hypothetical protein
MGPTQLPTDPINNNFRTENDINGPVHEHTKQDLYISRYLRDTVVLNTLAHSHV